MWFFHLSQTDTNTGKYAFAELTQHASTQSADQGGLAHAASTQASPKAGSTTQPGETTLIHPEVDALIEQVGLNTQDLLSYQELLKDYGPKLLGVMLLMLAAWVVSRWLGVVTLKACRKAKLDETLTLFFSKAIKWGIMILAILGCLSIFGVQTTSFAAGVAALGFAVGLALQGTLQQFAAGVMLLVFRPFKVGDLVEIAEEVGFVTEIDLFTTYLETYDKRCLIIPNDKIYGTKIENFSHDGVRRVDVPVGTAYDADLREVRALLESVIPRVSLKKDVHPQTVFLKGLGDFSIDWEVRIWCDPVDYWTVWEETVLLIKETLDEAGIEIPFPIQTLQVDSGDPRDFPAQAPSEA